MDMFRSTGDIEQPCAIPLDRSCSLLYRGDRRNNGLDQLPWNQECIIPNNFSCVMSYQHNNMSLRLLWPSGTLISLAGSFFLSGRESYRQECNTKGALPYFSLAGKGNTKGALPSELSHL